MKRLGCPLCKKPVLVADTPVGRRLACPVCKQQLVLNASGLHVPDGRSRHEAAPAARPKLAMVSLTALTRDPVPPPPAPVRPVALPPNVAPAKPRRSWWVLPAAAVSGCLLTSAVVGTAVLGLLGPEPGGEPTDELRIIELAPGIGRASNKPRTVPELPAKPSRDPGKRRATAAAATGLREAAPTAVTAGLARKPGPPAASLPGDTGSDPIQAVLQSVAVVGIPGDELGSGFVAAPGVVVTNHHVIEDAVIGDLRISFPDNEALAGRELRAELIHLSIPDDLAFLAINADVRPLTIKPEYAHVNGQKVVAVGSPGSGGDGPTLENLTTDGRLGPELKLDGDGARWALSMAVNGGNSGGPLVDAQTGHVVGVIVAKFTKTEAQSLAIPHATLVREMDKASRVSKDTRTAVLSLHRQRYCLRRMAQILAVTNAVFRRSIAAAVANSDAGGEGMDAAFNEFKTSAAKVLADDFANFTGTVGGEVEELQNDPHCDPSVRRGLKKLLADIESQANDIRRAVPRQDIPDFLGRFEAAVDGSQALVVSLAERLQISPPDVPKDAE
jgi:S1-C subfamily serine protease